MYAIAAMIAYMAASAYQSPFRIGSSSMEATAGDVAFEEREAGAAYHTDAFTTGSSMETATGDGELGRMAVHPSNAKAMVIRTVI